MVAIDFPHALHPFDSLVADENTWLWEAPVANPEDGKLYAWKETK